MWGYPALYLLVEHAFGSKNICFRAVGRGIAQVVFGDVAFRVILWSFFVQPSVREEN